MSDIDKIKAAKQKLDEQNVRKAEAKATQQQQAVAAAKQAAADWEQFSLLVRKAAEKLKAELSASNIAVEVTSSNPTVAQVSVALDPSSPNPFQRGGHPAITYREIGTAGVEVLKRADGANPKQSQLKNVGSLVLADVEKMLSDFVLEVVQSQAT